MRVRNGNARRQLAATQQTEGVVRRIEPGRDDDGGVCSNSVIRGQIRREDDSLTRRARVLLSLFLKFCVLQTVQTIHKSQRLEQQQQLLLIIFEHQLNKQSFSAVAMNVGHVCSTLQLEVCFVCGCLPAALGNSFYPR